MIANHKEYFFLFFSIKTKRTCFGHHNPVIISSIKRYEKLNKLIQAPNNNDFSFSHARISIRDYSELLRVVYGRLNNLYTLHSSQTRRLTSKITRILRQTYGKCNQARLSQVGQPVISTKLHQKQQLPQEPNYCYCSSLENKK